MCAVSNSAGVRTSTTRGGVDESRSFSSSAGLIVAAAGAFMAFSLVKRAPVQRAQFRAVLVPIPVRAAGGTGLNRRDVYVCIAQSGTCPNLTAPRQFGDTKPAIPT